MQRKKLIARSVHAEKKLVKSYLLILYRNEMGLRKNPSSSWYINEEDLSMNNNEDRVLAGARDYLLLFSCTYVIYNQKILACIIMYYLREITSTLPNFLS